MGFTSRKRRASDADYKAPSSVVKRLKLSEEVQSTPIQHNRGITLQEESDDPLPPSSAPSSPVFWDDNNEPERSEKSPVRPMSLLNLESLRKFENFCTGGGQHQIPDHHTFFPHLGTWRPSYDVAAPQRMPSEPPGGFWRLTANSLHIRAFAVAAGG
ncbi:hypothetical protein R3P38DRAFT_2786496 [Favolaschia claudopus]|uniref:Uncharacterized protein n=1 Tax=Favolaschia claudopus TaxID=2862362 RepID=A0AAW0ASY4_9AGAR